MLQEQEIVKINGKDFKVEPFTQEIQEIFARYMQNEYLQIIKDNKNEFGDDYLDVLKRHFFQVSRGFYNFGSENFFEFIKCNKEFYQLMWTIFSKNFTADVWISKEDLIAWIEENSEEVSLLFQRYFENLDIKKK